MGFKSKKELIKVGLLFAVIILAVILTGRFAFGVRLNFPIGFIESVRDFFTSDLKLSAADYKDGTIILIKPIATGVGKGRYEAGDIVEIRDGEELYQKYGENDFLGREEKTMLLPLYYPAKLTEEEKQKLIQPEPASPSQGGNEKRRQYGVDYTQFLSDSEIIKVRDFKGLKRLPEIDLSAVLKEKPENQASVVQLPKELTKIEKTKKTLNKFARKIIPFVFAATESIKTIMQSGGDYATLNAWEAAQQADLVTPDRIAVAQIDGAWTAADTTAVTIDGWTTSATNYIKIYTTAAARHDGKWNTGKYRLEANVAGRLFSIEDDYVYVDGLQVDNIRNGGDSATHGIYSNNTGTVLSNNIIRKTNANNANNSAGIQLTYSGKAYNNIVYDYRINIYCVPAAASQTFIIYNNTVYGSVNHNISTYHNYQSNTIYYLKNNLAQSAGASDYDISTTYGTVNNTSNNLSEDATSPNVDYRN